MTALDIAIDHIRRGRAPVPVPYRTKKPILPEWQRLRITEATAPEYFNGAPQNVGVILGAASDGLTDVDLDCAEAVTVASYLLPRTTATFGRAGRRFSHWIYRTKLAETCDLAVIEYLDPCKAPDDKATLVELRIGGGGKGAQTVFPGSTHETGEAIAWEEAGEPAEVDGDDLHQRVARVAAAALLARYWPKGARHKAALAAGGMLAHGGWSASDAKLFVEAVARAASDEEWRDRVKSVANSFAEHEGGRKVTGLPTLAGIIDPRVAQRVAQWLGLVTTSARGPPRRHSERGRQARRRCGHSGRRRPGFRQRYAGRLRYDHHAGAWFEWTGTHWRRDERARAFAFVRELGREKSRRGQECRGT